MAEFSPVARDHDGILDRLGPPPTGTTPPVPISLEVTLEWAPGEVVLVVSGEIDMLTAPVLGGVLGALDVHESGRVVIDMAAISFMDAAGLRVIAPASIDLAPNRLTIRSPQPTIRWLLVHFDLGGVIESAADPHLASRLALVPDVESTPGATAAAGALVPQVVASARTDLVDAALRLITALAQATIGGVDGASVSITRHGTLTTVAASDETITEMDRDQYATGEGPCLSAAAEGQVFHVDALADEHRWPQFIPRAINDGIGSILSNPLMTATGPVGALNLYSRAAHGFGPEDQELAARLAAQASSLPAEAGFDISDSAVAARLLGALKNRAIISQAQGVVMAQQGGSADAAFSLLRDASKETGVPIRQEADKVIAGTQRRELRGEVAT